MQIFGIIGIAILGTSLAVLLRPLRPELALTVGIVTGIIVLLRAVGELSGLMDTLRGIASEYGLDTSYISALLKIMGIAYASQFGAQICADAGENAIAGKVELFGRILILSVAAPIVILSLGSAIQLLKTWS